MPEEWLDHYYFIITVAVTTAATIEISNQIHGNSQQPTANNNNNDEMKLSLLSFYNDWIHNKHACGSYERCTP